MSLEVELQMRSCYSDLGIDGGSLNCSVMERFEKCLNVEWELYQQI